MTISVTWVAIYDSYNDLVQNLYSDTDTKPTGCVAKTLIKKTSKAYAFQSRLPCPSQLIHR